MTAPARLLDALRQRFPDAALRLESRTDDTYDVYVESTVFREQTHFEQQWAVCAALEHLPQTVVAWVGDIYCTPR